MSVFVEEMNKKSEQIGMKTATFVNPTGLEWGNLGKADDVLVLLDIAMANKAISTVWGLDSALIRVKSKTGIFRDVILKNTFLSENISPYTVVGRKTGSNGSLFNIAIVLVDSNNDTTKCVILGAHSELERLQYLSNLLKNNVDNNYVSYCNDSYVCGGELLSITKLLSIILVSQYYDELSEFIEIKSSDVMPGSGIPLFDGDILSKQDAIKAALISSSNTATYALARYVGSCILYQKYIDKLKHGIK